MLSARIRNPSQRESKSTEAVTKLVAIDYSGDQFIAGKLGIILYTVALNCGSSMIQVWSKCILYDWSASCTDLKNTGYKPKVGFSCTAGSDRARVRHCNV